jgi:hypothetical protein
MAADRLSSATLIVLDPVECAAASSYKLEFFSKLALARKRIVVLAEMVESTWHESQLRLPVNFDAVFNIGFVPQGDEHPFSDVPYHFVFNGPTEEEKRVIATLSPSKRGIPWAVVGPQDLNHCNLVAELTNYKLYPEGFCSLHPPRSRGEKGRGLLSSSGLAAVLSKTRYCVWRSDDSFAYHESFRFIQALLAGAVPCKIDNNSSWDKAGIPGIFPSVQSFYTRVQEEGYWSMYCSAREFWVSKGLLAEHLEEALRLV